MLHMCCYACFTDEESKLVRMVKGFPQNHILHKDRPRTESQWFRLISIDFFLLIKKKKNHIDQSAWTSICTGWYQIFPGYLAAILASQQAPFNPCSATTHAWDTSHQEDWRTWEENPLGVRRHTEFNFNPADLSSGSHSIQPLRSTHWLSGQVLQCS